MAGIEYTNTLYQGAKFPLFFVSFCKKNALLLSIEIFYKKSFFTMLSRNGLAKS